MNAVTHSGAATPRRSATSSANTPSRIQMPSRSRSARVSAVSSAVIAVAPASHKLASRTPKPASQIGIRSRSRSESATARRSLVRPRGAQLEQRRAPVARHVVVERAREIGCGSHIRRRPAPGDRAGARTRPRGAARRAGSRRARRLPASWPAPSAARPRPVSRLPSFSLVVSRFAPRRRRSAPEPSAPSSEPLPFLRDLRALRCEQPGAPSPHLALGVPETGRERARTFTPRARVPRAARRAGSRASRARAARDRRSAA